MTRLTFIELIITSTVAAGLSYFIAFIILPSLVVDLAVELDSLNIASAVNLVTWLEIVIIVFFFAILVIILSIREIGVRRERAFNSLISSFLASYIFTVYLISQVGFFILAANQPELFEGLSFLEKLINFYRYPSALVILRGDPFVIWSVFTLIFLILFNFKMWQVQFRKGE